MLNIDITYPNSFRLIYIFKRHFYICLPKKNMKIFLAVLLINNSPKLETTLISMNCRTDKYIIV